MASTGELHKYQKAYMKAIAEQRKHIENSFPVSDDQVEKLYEEGIIDTDLKNEIFSEDSVTIQLMDDMLNSRRNIKIDE